MSSQSLDHDGSNAPSCEASNHAVSVPAKKRPERKLSLAALSVERGYFANLDEAQRWIMAGKVLVNERLLDKPGMPVAVDAVIRITGRTRYASRAGYKLETALDYFAVDVVGLVALDCGASTGGFTDCLLQHGAALVYAVDAGHGQLLGRLRLDSRVRNLERTNLSDLIPAMLNPLPTLITLDLSYLSLTRALPVATALLASQGRILALVKPLFEVESSQARGTGRIDDPILLVKALQQVIEAGLACGLTYQGAIKLALRPHHGVHEFFVSFARSPGALSCCSDAETLLSIIEGQGEGRHGVESS